MITPNQERQTVQDCVHVGVLNFVIFPYDPRDLLERIERAIVERQEVDSSILKQNVRRTLSNIVELPTISQVYTKIEALNQASGGGDVSASDLERVMSLDQALTSKVLRLANSALFGFNRPVTSVKDASSLLGFQTIRNAVLTVSCFDTLEGVPELDDFPKTEFWKHCLGCGIIAKSLAEKIDLEPDTALVGGILHDMGKVVFCRYFPDAFREALLMARMRSCTILDAEEKEIHLTHTDVGHFLAEKWGLPSPLPNVIGAHHTLEAPESDVKMVCVIHIADCLVRGLQIGAAGDAMELIIDPRALAALNITREQITDWTPVFAELAHEQIEAFDLGGTPSPSGKTKSPDEE